MLQVVSKVRRVQSVVRALRPFAMGVAALGFGSLCTAALAQSPADRVHQVVVRYDSAFAAGNYRVACSLLTGTAKHDVSAFGPGGCRHRLLGASGFTRQQARAFASADVSSADVRGNFANVVIVVPGLPTNAATLHREHGRWLIALPPAAITPGG